MFKFLVEAFRILHLLKFETDLIDTLFDIKYYSKIYAAPSLPSSQALRSRSQNSEILKCFHKAII